MKKVCLMLTLLLFFIFGSVFAQENTGDTDVFCKTVPIVKIYSFTEGYRVVYQKSDMSSGVLYVPSDWFDAAAGKAELVSGFDASYPYFSIFWVDGEFSHIRLYVIDKLTHESWGTMPSTFDTADKFNIEKPDIEF